MALLKIQNTLKSENDGEKIIGLGRKFLMPKTGEKEHYEDSKPISVPSAEKPQAELTGITKTKTPKIITPQMLPSSAVSATWPPTGIKPYYCDESVCIIHGDCREILPGLPKVDLVLTDPPYGMNFQSNYRFFKHEKITNDSELPVETIKGVIKMAQNAAYVFCRWDNLKEMPKPKSVLAWVKNNWSMGDLEHEHGRQWEAICFYPGLKHEFVERIPDVIHADRTGNKLHPTQKPENLLKKLILANVGKVVFDPFCGSGSTLRAAKDLGRYSIGIEIEERYAEIAARRMSQEVLL